MGVFHKLFDRKKNNSQRGNGVIHNTAAGSIESTALTLRTLSETYPESVLLYHTEVKILKEFLKEPILRGTKTNIILGRTDEKTLGEFLGSPLLSGARIIVIESGKAKDESPYIQVSYGASAIDVNVVKGCPFTKGINVFDTPALLELVARHEFDKLGKVLLYTDDYQVAQSATGFSIDSGAQELYESYGVHASKKEAKYTEESPRSQTHYSAMVPKHTFIEEDPISLHRQGIALCEVQKYGEAVEKFLRSSELYQNKNNFFDASSMMFKAGECNYMLKDYSTAINCFNRSAETAFERGFDRLGVSALEYVLDCYKALRKEKSEEAMELQKKISEAKAKLASQPF